MQRAKPLVLRLMTENRQTAINLLLNCEMVRQDLISGDTETIIAHFRIRTTIYLEGNDDEEEFRIFLEIMEQGIFNFNQRGSNCMFQRVVNLEINLADYFPTDGSSYIPLPEKPNGKKAIINMKNQDNQCSKWSLTRALNPVKKDPQRITKLLMEQSENPNWDKIEFPVKLKDLNRFEKNQISVNIFGFNGEVYPLRISKKKGVPVVNPLLISGKGGGGESNIFA